MISPPQDILPTLPGNLPGRSGLPATTGLLRPLVLEMARFIGAALRPECAGRGVRLARRAAPAPFQMPLPRERDGRERGITEERPHRPAAGGKRRSHHQIMSKGEPLSRPLVSLGG